MNIASINMNVNVYYCQDIESFEYTYTGVIIAESYGCPVFKFFEVIFILAVLVYTPTGSE